MNIQELFHLWANQSRNSAKSGNVFFDGPTVFSYGHHFPVATLRTLPDVGDVVFFNPYRYSSSTSKHQCYARSAVHSRERFTLSPDLWESVTGKATLDKALAIQAERDAESNRLVKESKARAAKDQRERKKLEKLEWPELAGKWRAGENIPRFALERGPVLLRLCPDGKRIETSRGAIVPARVAPLAWSIIQKGQSDPTFDWGNYTGLNVTPSAVVIGCHSIPLDEVRLMAETLKIAA